MFIESKTINAKVKDLASRISRDYRTKDPVFVCVLNGAFVFLSDLVRNLQFDVEIDFIKLSSYRNERVSSGKPEILLGLNTDIRGRNVIIIEDIVDSGISLKYAYDLISGMKPSSLESATLLYKKGLSELKFKIKYVGFKIPDKFVVGYGLDFAQKYRNLKSIYILKN